MNRILKGIVWKNVLAYLDDVIVLGKRHFKTILIIYEKHYIVFVHTK